MKPLPLLIVGIGGAFGSICRYLAQVCIGRHTTPTFPVGTLVVNLTGCFLIGFIFTISATEGRFYLSPLQRQFIMIGILGGYTTFSSFSLQTLLLAQNNQWFGAAANVTLSVVLCLVGTWLGSLLAGSLNQIR